MLARLLTVRNIFNVLEEVDDVKSNLLFYEQVRSEIG
jgi:hypothetical protein